MNSINRYIPVSVPTSVNINGVGMQSCDDGAWVSYAMHKKEIEHLQARLKALESTQKHQISAPSIIADHVEQAIKEAVGKLVHEACEQLLNDLPNYNGDPCHSTVDAFVNELADGPGKTVKGDGVNHSYLAADELTKNGKFFTFGSNFGEGKALTMSTAKMEPRSGGYGYSNRHVWAVGECESARDRKVAVCYYAGGNEFINGCEYEYEVDDCETDSKPRFIHIVQDAFVSDLKGDYRWRALKVDNVKLVDAYEIVNPDGGVVAKLYIK